MRIGLISDTHLSSSQLPQAIIDAFDDVELILHAGDLVTLDVLRLLETVAPVHAVQGNMDLPGVRLKLPLKTVTVIEGHRVGLIHGHHVPHPSRVLASPLNFEAMHDYLLSEFKSDQLDCIVYGHTHQARIETYHDVLFVNPGSATRGRGSIALLTVSRNQMHAGIVQLS